MAVPLPLGDVLIGRGQECYLRINEPMVSRRHARLRVSIDRVTLEDLGSRNGSYLNGIGVGEPVSLSPGDLVVIGSQQFTVELGDEPGARRHPTSVAQTMGGYSSQSGGGGTPSNPIGSSFSGPTVAPQAPSGASPGQGPNPSGSLRVRAGVSAASSIPPPGASVISVGGDARSGTSLTSLAASAASMPTSVGPAFSPSSSPIITAEGPRLSSEVSGAPSSPTSQSGGAKEFAPIGSRVSSGGEAGVPTPATLTTTSNSLGLCANCGAPAGEGTSCARCGAPLRDRPDRLDRADRPDFAEPVPTLTARRGSSAQLLWGLSDKVLAFGRVDDAEKMMAPRLQALLDQAEAGAMLDEDAISATLGRVLRLAVATRRDAWLEWIFTFSRAYSYHLPAAMLDELYTLMFTQRPALAVGLSIEAYAQMVSDEKLILRLVALRRLCRE